MFSRDCYSCLASVDLLRILIAVPLPPLGVFFVDPVNAATLVDHATGDEVSADRGGDQQKQGDQQFVQAQTGFTGAEMRAWRR